MARFNPAAPAAFYRQKREDREALELKSFYKRAGLDAGNLPTAAEQIRLLTAYASALKEQRAKFAAEFGQTKDAERALRAFDVELSKALDMIADLRIEQARPDPRRVMGLK